MDMRNEEVKTAAEIAEHFEVSRQSVYLWIEKGCPHYKGKGRHTVNIFLKIEEVERWLKSSK